MASEATADRVEWALLVVAGLGVLLYGADLLDLARGPAVEAVARGIDVVFAVDLAVRVSRREGRYLQGPWFLIDVLSALPALAQVAGLPGLELLRLARVLRALRSLRVLRGLRQVRVLDWAAQSVADEGRQASLAIGAAVLAAAVSLVAAVTWVRRAASDSLHDPADVAEAGVLLGTFVGLGLVVVVARVQLAGFAGRQLRALLDVALPRQVAEAFLRHPDTYDRTIRGPGTVIFCDLKGFSATVERCGLEGLKEHLERVLDVIVDVHVEYDLIVDKFIGDAVMSFRGGDLVTGDARDHATRCVRAALATSEALRTLGDPWFHGVKVGGASAEDLLIGTFGASKRLSFTVLHDRVNVAARLEAACGVLGTDTLFDDKTVQIAGPLPDVVWRRVGRLGVHGKQQCVAVFEALNSSADGPWRTDFEAALAAWDGGGRANVAERFLAVDGSRPGGDPLARFYASRCSTQGPDGVLTLGK